jgi:hypothetical protein
MAFGARHNLFTFHGKLPGGEDWSIGLRTNLAGDFGGGQLDILGQFATERFAQFRNQLASGTQGRTASWGGGTTFDGVTAREISPAGVTLHQRELKPVTAMPASASNSVLPNQCAICVTLDTDQPGRTKKGRVYLPLLGDIQMDGGRALQNSVIAGQFGIFMSSTVGDWLTLDGNDFNAPGLHNTRWVIASRTDGAINVITKIRVGTIVDTQRRRRASLPEIYASQTITQGA